jgi:hypothetical protein
MPRPKRSRQRPDPGAEQFALAQRALMTHPLFAPLLMHANLRRVDDGVCPRDAWAVVSRSGTIAAHPTRRGETPQWIYVIAHCLLHLGFEQFVEQEQPLAWNLACDVVVDRFLGTLKLGTPPEGFLAPLDAPGQSEAVLYAHFCRRGVGTYRSDDMRLDVEVGVQDTAGEPRLGATLTSEPVPIWQTPSDAFGHAARQLTRRPIA